jgi:hypothetical protein
MRTHHHEKKHKESMVASLDLNGDGKVDWMEFVQARNAGENAEMPIDESEVLRQIIIYIAFICVFTLHTIRGTTNANNFFFAHNIQGQFAGVEVAWAHSPSFAKTFEDVATVEEVYHWMLGPFVHTAFSPNTFDGSADWDFDGGEPQGKTLGYGKFIGPVRISQVRVQKRQCNEMVHPKLSSSFNFTCYGEELQGDFSLAYENKANFSEFIQHDYPGDGSHESAIPIKSLGNFTFDGMNAQTGAALVETVAEQRAKYMSSFVSTGLRFGYPSPAFGVTISPLIGKENATKIIKDLFLSNYIDLHTRAIFIDASVYNPMLGQLCFCRMVLETSSAGGVIPSYYFQPVKMFETVTDEDAYYRMLLYIVGLFYSYYFYKLVEDYRKRGTAIFNEFLTIAQCANLTFFITSVACKFSGEMMFPADAEVNGVEYVDAFPPVQFKVMATSIAGINVFLNWFKFIQVLSYSPVFALINNTLARSAHELGGFMLVFFIIFYGFAQAHCMIFQGRLYAFRTLPEAIFTLMRSLLGDFDFEELQVANYHMGPLLFILFVALAVFVVLNMLIAIISESYEASKEEMKCAPKVELLRDVRDYMIFRTIRHPKVQNMLENYVPAFANKFYKRMGIALDGQRGIVPLEDKIVVSAAPRDFDVFVPDDMGGEPLGVELEQVFDHTHGRVKGVTVVKEPFTGPLAGKVKPGDELIAINKEAINNSSLVEVGQQLKHVTGEGRKRLTFKRPGTGKTADGEASVDDETSTTGESDTSGSAKELAKLRQEMAHMQRTFECEMRDMHATMQKMVSLMGSRPQLRV